MTVVSCCSIDVDILNLVDELNVDEFVKEASSALDDEDKFRAFIKEKATILVERFLVRFVLFECILYHAQMPC